MKQLITTAVLLFSTTAFAQVGINNTSPKATLDITAKTNGTKPEGLIIPQLTGDQIRAATTATPTPVYGTAQKGLIVYASAADSAPAGATVNITAPGYYYFDGSVWQKIATGNTLNTSLASGNILVGNASNVATAVMPIGDVAISNAGITSIGAGKVTNGHLASAAALTVKGNATNAAASPTDIAAGTDGYVLRRSGTSLGFGTVATAGIADGAVTTAKIATDAVTSTQIATGAVSNADLASAAALTVKGNATNTTASPTDIAAGTDGYVLRRSGTALGFGTVGTAGIADGAVTTAKIQGSSTNGQVLTTNASGVTSWATPVDNNTTYTGSTSINLNGTSFERTALTGDVTASANSNATSVVGIQGRSVSNTAPANGQVLGWNGSVWVPTNSDATNDAWVNDTTNGLVKLGTKADGTARTAGTDFVAKDNGQIGIGTSSPNASAALDITATNKGLLIPRVALTSTTDQTTISNPATGLMIYNTATAGTAPYDVIPNLMVNNGTPTSPSWTKVVSQNTVTGTGVIGSWSGSNTGNSFTGTITSVEDGISFRSTLAGGGIGYIDYASVTSGTNLISTAGSEESNGGWYWKGKDTTTVGTSFTAITQGSGIVMGSGRRTITVVNLTNGYIYRITLMIDSSNNRAFYFVEKVNIRSPLT